MFYFISFCVFIVIKYYNLIFFADSFAVKINAALVFINGDVNQKCVNLSSLIHYARDKSADLSHPVEVFIAHLTLIQIHARFLRIFLNYHELKKYIRLLYIGETDSLNILATFFLNFYFVIIRKSEPSLDLQSVSVGHYLPHPNNERVQQRDTDSPGQSEPRSTSPDPWPFDTHSVQTIHQPETSVTPFSHPVWGLPRNRVETITVFKCETEPKMTRRDSFGTDYHRGSSGRPRGKGRNMLGSSCSAVSYNFRHMLALLI